MALKVVLSCDYPRGKSGCPEPASVKFEASLGDRCFRADYCDEDRLKVEGQLRKMGAIADAVVVNSKRRGAHVAKSGASFSTAEARVWLRQNGYDVTTQGRVSDELLQLYAVQH